MLDISKTNVDPHDQKLVALKKSTAMESRPFLRQAAAFPSFYDLENLGSGFVGKGRFLSSRVGRQSSPLINVNKPDLMTGSCSLSAVF